MIRVALADDHPEVRLALRLLLRLAEEMEVVCAASSGQEGLDCVHIKQVLEDPAWMLVGG